MAWRLEIHHIGLNRRGDATLILAINDGMGANQLPQVRSMLIDGGMDLEHAFVNNYIQARLGVVAGAAVPPLNVIVVTHYDVDHFNGITGLLQLGGAGGAANIYNNVIIFDQGFSEGSSDNSYLNYRAAIALRGARSRVTRNVLGTTNIAPPYVPPGGWQAANWLLNHEIMWTNPLGNAVTPAALLAAPPGTNLNPPRVTCFAANQYVQGAAGTFGGHSADLKNEHSLGFIVEFNNFRYYIAGDLESPQEDQLRLFLNPTDDLAGRVVAIKASHHGGNTSTSQAFLDRLRPDAAFISCGNVNQHLHPAQQVVNVLDGYLWGGAPHAAAPPPSSRRPVPYYLTGYYVPGPPPLSHGAPDISYTAGDPSSAPRIPGHIVLTVTEAQSLNDQRGESYFGVREAVRWAARGTGVLEPAATGIGTAAANAFAGAGLNTRQAAAQTAAQAAAVAAGATAATGLAASFAAGHAMSGAGPGGANYDAQTIANYTAAQTLLPAAGGNQTQAAVAGAAAGAAFASGEKHWAQSATSRGLIGSGIALMPAINASLNCFSAITLAVGVGLFNVSFNDYFRVPAGLQNICHTG